MKFVFRRIANPTIKQTPYGKGFLVVWRSIRPRKERGKESCGFRKLVGGEIVPSVVVSALSDVIILNTRLHGITE
jgi:hypothetical protein